MNLSRLKGVGAVAAVSALALVLSACGSDQAVTSTSDPAPTTSTSDTGSTPGSETSEPADPGVELDAATIAGAGASSMESAQNAWMAEFQNLHANISMSYDPVGSGGGRTQLITGVTAYGGSDSALKPEEIEQSKDVCGPNGAYDLPLYISPIAVIFNLEGIKELNLSPTVLGKIFNNEITKWDDPAIVADNPGVDLPNLDITPVHRSDESGTTANFTDYLSKTAGDAWPHDPSGVWPIDGGQSDQGTSGVVNTVTGGNGTIGYADASKAGDLGKALIQVGDEWVPYSPEAAAKVVEVSPMADGRSEHDIAIALDRTTTEAGAYPLVLVAYTLVCSEYSDAAIGNAVVEYIRFIASPEGQQISHTATGSAPISDALRDKVYAALDSITIG